VKSRSSRGFFNLPVQLYLAARAQTSVHSEPRSDRPSIAVVIESGHSFIPLACGHFKIRRDMIQMRMAEQPLHGVERVPLCYQTARKRSAVTFC
jgi:hypothetical protein